MPAVLGGTDLVAWFGEQPDPGPGVVAVALAAALAGVGLPGDVGQQGGDRLDAQRPGRRWHPPVRCDLQHETQAVLTHGAARPGSVP
jgi:hypothetical protein